MSGKKFRLILRRPCRAPATGVTLRCERIQLHCTIVPCKIPLMRMTFRHMPVFVSEWKRLGLTDEDLQALERQIMERPEAGAVMSGTGGVRKLRFAPPSWHTGKSGATRVCYVSFVDAVCYLFLIFPKNERANLSAKDKAALKVTVDALRRLHARPTPPRP